MAMTFIHRGASARGEARAARPRAGAMRERGKARRIAAVLTFAGLVVVSGLAAVGFFVGASRFLEDVRAMPDYAALQQPADGVVALTGGPDRIADAASLLASGQAKRMLISGVNQQTTRTALARETPRFSEIVDCCAEMGYAAENTLGNAVEIAAWARRNELRSLIVVTSDYHMPRAIAELREALPGSTLIAYPVRSSRLEPSGWWRDLDTLRLVWIEYAKYLRTKLRNHVDPRRAEILARSATGAA